MLFIKKLLTINHYWVFDFIFIYLKHGTMEIINHANKMRAILNFKPYSWSSKELHKVEGFIFDSQ